MRNIFIAILNILLITSCGQSDSESTNLENLNNDTTNIFDKSDSRKESINEGKTLETPIPVIKAEKKNKSEEILSNIDKYLISAVQFTSNSSGEGITDAIVTLENTLQDITIQKAFLEVSILTAANKEYRTDYYTLQNIEPGDIKRIKIPTSKLGITIRSRIVKFKSDVLTNGEMILVGKN